MSAGAGLQAAFEKVSIRSISCPDARWATWGPAGEPTVLAEEYCFEENYLRDAGPGKAAAAAASLPRGCSVTISGYGLFDDDDDEDDFEVEADSGLPALAGAAEVAEALVEHQIKLERIPPIPDWRDSRARGRAWPGRWGQSEQIVTSFTNLGSLTRAHLPWRARWRRAWPPGH